MYRLIIDSSTKLMWIGLVKDLVLVDKYIRIAKKDHAKYMVDAVDNLLQQNNLTIGNIKEIIVGSGPGSYTGLRVAGMVAKMLAYTKEIPLYEVSSIFLLSSGFSGRVAGLVDARRNQYFSAIYEGLETIKEEALMLKEEIDANLEFQKSQIIILDEENYRIDIKKIIAKKQLVKDVHSFVPNYLRKTEAERNL